MKHGCSHPVLLSPPTHTHSSLSWQSRRRQLIRFHAGQRAVSLSVPDSGRVDIFESVSTKFTSTLSFCAFVRLVYHVQVRALFSWVLSSTRTHPFLRMLWLLFCACTADLPCIAVCWQRSRGLELANEGFCLGEQHSNVHGTHFSCFFLPGGGKQICFNNHTGQAVACPIR